LPHIFCSFARVVASENFSICKQGCNRESFKIFKLWKCC
jgi:hypothetical protein